MLKNSVESSLGPFIVLYRVSYSSVALIAHHDQGGFQKEELFGTVILEGESLTDREECQSETRRES